MDSTASLDKAQKYWFLFCSIPSEKNHDSSVNHVCCNTSFCSSSAWLAATLFLRWHSVSLKRIFALNAFSKRQILRIFDTFLVENRSFLAAILSEMRCLLRHKCLASLTCLQEMMRFLLLLLSNNVPWASNLLIMCLSAAVDGRFLLWYPGMDRKDRLTTVYDFIKSNCSIANFFSSKVSIVCMKFKQIIKLHNAKEENVHVFAVSQAYHLSLYLIRSFFFLMLKT